MTDHHTIKTLRTRHGLEERELVLRAIDECNGSLAAICGWLGVGSTTVQRLIARHDLGQVYAARSTGRGRPRLPRPGDLDDGRRDPR